MTTVSSKPEGTATSAATESELGFPEATPRPRTAEQFMALSDTAVAAIARTCRDERLGGTLRQELFDAHQDLTARWTRELATFRNDFRRRFEVSFVAIQKFGPECTTAENPPPPITANAMTARQWLELTPEAISRMISQLTHKTWGRNIRAEAKRAYRDGSPAEKSALFALFAGYAVNPLTLYPSELI